MLLTADEYLVVHADDRRRTSLVEGVVVVMEPSDVHQHTLLELAVALRTWTAEDRGRGRVSLPLDIRLDEHNVFAPDVLWYAEGHGAALGSPRPYPVPDLAVEIRSPSTWRYDLGAKKAAYGRRGLPELWLVDTVAESVLTFRRSAAGLLFDVVGEERETLTSPLLPGLAIDVGALFG